MKIALVVWNLTQGKGGRQRAGAALANEMCRRGHDCVVIVNDHLPRPPVFPLDASIQLERLDTTTLLEYQGKFLRYRNCREHTVAIRDKILSHAPDVLMVMSSSREIVMWPTILKGAGIPLVLSERTDPKFMESLCWRCPEERIAILSSADMILCQMEGFREYYPDFLASRLRVIPNSVQPATALADSAGEERVPKIILNVARMDIHKHQPLLARAFGLLAQDFPDWELHYWGGKGPLAEALRAEIKEGGLAGRAYVHDLTSNISPIMQQAHVFAFPSEFEGCPNALLEAQAHGLPSVGYRRCGGTNEIIEHGVNGLLFDALTPASLARRLQKLMLDVPLRKAMGKAAFQVAKEYAPGVIFSMYEKMFFSVVDYTNSTRLDAENLSVKEVACRNYLERMYAGEWI